MFCSYSQIVNLKPPQMSVKIDTKEKFTEIRPDPAQWTDIIAADTLDACRAVLEKPIKNLVLDLSGIGAATESWLLELTQLQQSFYEKNASFVVCALTPSLEEQLEKADLLESLHFTPTLSEAWDIVQMEEIERELLDGDDILFSAENE